MIVENLQHLKLLSHNKNGDFSDFYISLAGGIAKSSKRILYDKELDEFSLVHEIDESYQEFPSSEIGHVTNLLEAIEKKALFKV
jgi:hypothetical protein